MEKAQSFSQLSNSTSKLPNPKNNLSEEKKKSPTVSLIQLNETNTPNRPKFSSLRGEDKKPPKIPLPTGLNLKELKQTIQVRSQTGFSEPTSPRAPSPLLISPRAPSPLVVSPRQPKSPRHLTPQTKSQSSSQISRVDDTQKKLPGFRI